MYPTYWFLDVIVFDFCFSLFLFCVSFFNTSAINVVWSYIKNGGSANDARVMIQIERDEKGSFGGSPEQKKIGEGESE